VYTLEKRGDFGLDSGHGAALIPYVLPFLLYLLLTRAAGAVPHFYGPAYAVSVLIVAGASIRLWRTDPPFRPHRRVGPAILAGVLGIVLWIGLSRITPLAELTANWPDWLRPGARPGFDPGVEIASAPVRMLFLVCRGFGLILVTPLVEEVFWRGFLARWLLGREWRKQPVGAFTPASFLWVCALFALAHPEWIEAFLYSAILNALLAWRRDLWDVIVAHAVSNAILFVYVLATGAFTLW
jgi:hypothetical protein